MKLDKINAAKLSKIKMSNAFQTERAQMALYWALSAIEYAQMNGAENLEKSAIENFQERIEWINKGREK